MKFFSNHYFFPAVQFLILAGFLYVLYRDFHLRRHRAHSPVGDVKRGDESMKTFEKISGALIAFIITIMNKSVFDEDHTWGHYAAFFNIADIVAVLYFVYLSPWGRNEIIKLQIWLRND